MKFKDAIQVATVKKTVVVKGRTVRHDGKDYGQNAVISLPAQDAGRLQELGFVVSLESVRQALQDPGSDEKEDSPGSDDDGDDKADSPKSDDAGGGTTGGAGGDDQNAGGADPDAADAAGSNKSGSVKKGAK